MTAVDDYTGQIERLLSAGCALFPDQPDSATAPGDDNRPVPPPPPSGTSGLAAASADAEEKYRGIDARIAQLTESLNQAVRSAAEQAARAGLHAKDIRDSVRVQADALTETADTSEGVGALVSTMDERLGAMSEHLTATREQLRASAQKIRQLSVELSNAAAGRG